MIQQWNRNTQKLFFSHPGGQGEGKTQGVIKGTRERKRAEGFSDQWILKGIENHLGKIRNVYEERKNKETRSKHGNVFFLSSTYGK